MREERRDAYRLNRKQAVSKGFFSKIHKYCGMVVDNGDVTLVSTVFVPIA